MSKKRWLSAMICTLAVVLALPPWAERSAAEGEAAAEPAVNLVSNGGFETGAEAPWGRTADLFFVTTEDVYSGTYSYKLQGRTGELDSNWPNQRTSGFTVEPNLDYLVMFQIKSSFPNAEHNPRVSIKAIPGATSSPTLGQVEIGAGDASGDWELRSFTFNSGANDKARLNISEHGGIHYFDEFAVIAMPAAIRPAAPAYELGAGATAQLTVLGEYGGEAEKDVTAYTRFASSDPEVVSVTASGILKAEKSGTATITMDMGGLLAEASVTVTSAALEELRFDAPIYWMAAGAQAQAAVTGVYQDNSEADVTADGVFVIEDPAVATVDSAGMLTGVSAGQTVLSFSYEGLTLTVPVQVTDGADGIDSLVIGSASPQLENGGTLQLTLTATVSEAQQDVTADAYWISLHPDKASVEAGEVTGIGGGIAVIKAYYKGLTAEYRVTVNMVADGGFEEETASPWQLASGFSISEEESYSGSQSLALQGEGVWRYARQTLQVEPNKDYALLWRAKSDFTGVTDDPKVAVKIMAQSLKLREYEITEDSGGEWRAHSFLFNSGSNSSLYLDISEHGGSHFFDEFLLVEPGSLSTLAFDKALYSLPMGSSVRYKVMAEYEDCFLVDVGFQSAVASSSPAVASVHTSTGTIRANMLGNAVITAMYGGRQATVQVEVEPALLSLTIEPASSLLTTGGTAQLAVVAHYAHGDEVVTDQTTFSSGNSSIAEVNGTGLVTGVGFGTTAIEAAFGGLTAAADITVNMLRSSVSEIELAEGEQQELRFMRALPDGVLTDITDLVSVSSEDPATAEYQDGAVIGLTAGETMIRAEYEGHQLTVAVRVLPAIIGIEAEAERLRMVPGESVTLAVHAVYSDGRREALEAAEIEWSSSEAETADISAAGLLQAIREGRATITAYYLDYTAEVQVDVVTWRTELVWKDGDGREIQALTPGAEVRAEAQLSSTEAMDAISILALYDRNGNLVALASQAGRVSADGQTLFTQGIQLPDQVEGMTLRWMLWNNWDERLPLVPAEQLTQAWNPQISHVYIAL